MQPLRGVLTYLLALVLVLQGAAAGVHGVMGPAHVHRAAMEPKLDDFRRWKAPSVAQGERYVALTGHSHGAASLTQRHFHAFDDSSVVRTGEDAADADADGGSSAGSSLVAVLGPVPHGVAWAPTEMSQRPASGPNWAVVTGFPGRIERPPQVA